MLLSLIFSTTTPAAFERWWRNEKQCQQWRI